MTVPTKPRGGMPSASPLFMLLVLWAGLLLFQFVLFFIAWLLGRATAPHSWSSGVWAEPTSGGIALVGVIFFLTGLILPRFLAVKNDAGIGVRTFAVFVMQLALFEMTNFAGFIIAILNNRNEILMGPLFALSLLGYLAAFPRTGSVQVAS